MASTSRYPFPTDTLPAEVADAYETLSHELADWLGAASPFASHNLVDYFEAHLTACAGAEHRIRYLCRLTMQGGVNGEPYPAAAHQLMQVQGAALALPFSDHEASEPFTETYYLSWLAVRLTEALCQLAGSSRLRGARAQLWAEWTATGGHHVQFLTDYPPTVQVLKYLFRVLVPFVRGDRTQSIGSLAEQVRQAVPRPAAGPRPPTPPPEPLPQTLQMLCQHGLTPADVRELLATLGAVDAATGRWHMGELTSKAARLKSAFPAAYRALASHGLLKQLEGPTWLKIFVVEFGVTLSPRMANYDTKGQVSKSFHNFYDEATRWAKVWKAKREADQ